MADRFPLIVNAVSKKIEEIVAGDNLDLSGNGVVIGADSGAGKYLSSNGTTVVWGTPGDVYLTTTQTVTNKTFEQCNINGSSNTITGIVNNSLVNSSININGVAIGLGGTVVTPNDNTVYAVSAQDGATAAKKIIRLTSTPTSGAGVDDDVTLVAGSNVTLDRSTDEITINSSYVDTDTITRVQSAVGGSLVTGDVTIAASGSSTVAQSGNTITISSTYTDTVTRVRGTSGQVYAAGDFTFLDGGATTVTQGVDGSGDPTITYTSVDTITRIKGGAAGSLVSGDVTFTGGANVTVSQSGQDVTIASVDTDTITRLASGTNAVLAGDFKFVGAGATNISQNTAGGVTTLTVTSANDDTGAALTASDGLILDGTNFELKNAANFTGNQVIKWDSGNNQLANSLISDNGSTVTITGDLIVNGTQSILNTTTLEVADNLIELRKGNNLVGNDGGIQLNRTTDSAGNTTAYQRLEWYESGAYWRSWDGSVANRFVSENETQTLTNKTLTNPTLTTPSLGAAGASSINGLIITSTASATLTMTASKTLDIQRDLTLTSDNAAAAVSANFRAGGNVAFTSDTLATFASTTSTQLRGLISDTTGTDRLVFRQSPTFLTSLITTSTGFALFNTGATAITAFGAASAITMGAAGGTFTVNQNLTVNEDLIVGSSITDNITLNGLVNIDNADLTLYGTSADPFKIGRGNSSVNTNIAVGHEALNANTSGSQNIAIGTEAQYTTNSGAANLALGHRALRANGIASDNIAIGRDTMLVSLTGEKNVAIGNNALETLTGGNANVCIGYYAGYAATGTGNVLIGPADDANQTNATFEPPSAGGDRQLVIGSGTEAWIRGDQAYDVTLNHNLTVDGNTTVKGNLTVNGSSSIVKSNIVQISDKTFEMGAVVSTTFAATVTDGTNNLTSITPTLGLIPGMEIQTTTGGITIPAGTTIVTITNNTAVVSANITGNGTATITALGPSDTSAEGGGIIVKGTTDKSLTYKHQDGGVTYNTWVSSEHMDLADNRHYSINGIYVADESTRTIGPNNGSGTGETTQTWTLGTAVAFAPSSLSLATGPLLIGNTSATNKNGGFTNILAIEGTSATTASISITRNSNDENPTYINLGKSRGTAIGSDGAVVGDDNLGQIDFTGSDGSGTFNNFAGIRGICDEANGVAVSNAESPGRLAFYTCPAGSTSPVERMRIKSTGQLLHTVDSASGHIAEFNQVHADNPGTVLINSPTDNNLRPAAVHLAQAGSVKWVLGQVYNSGSSQAFHLCSGTGEANSVLTVTTGGVISTGVEGSREITGGTSLDMQNFRVMGKWSGGGSIGKEIELISGYDSGVKMTAIGYNLTDVNSTSGGTYGGDLVFHTQPLYSSPTSPVPERFRITSDGSIYIKGKDNTSDGSGNGQVSGIAEINYAGNRVGGLVVASINDESMSADIKMPRKGCIVSLLGVSDPSSYSDNYPQPDVSGLVYIDCGLSKNIIVMDTGSTVGSKLGSSNTYDASFSNFANNQTTIIPGTVDGTFRIVNREGTSAYRYFITFL